MESSERWSSPSAISRCSRLTRSSTRRTGPLLGGGGVDGAIHAAAGPGLLEECRALNGCDTGNARITRGYGLPSAHVIHTSARFWLVGTRTRIAFSHGAIVGLWRSRQENDLQTIAFPAISTGIYRFPG